MTDLEHNTIPVENQEALVLWHRVLAQAVHQGNFDLSARQMAMLLQIYNEPGRHTIKRLSKELNVSKPAICRAIDSLSGLQLVRRKTDPDDRRIVFVELTAEGTNYLHKFSEQVVNNLMQL